MDNEQMKGDRKMKEGLVNTVGRIVTAQTGATCIYVPSLISPVSFHPLCLRDILSWSDLCSLTMKLFYVFLLLASTLTFILAADDETNSAPQPAPPSEAEHLAKVAIEGRYRIRTADPTSHYDLASRLRAQLASHNLASSHVITLPAYNLPAYRLPPYLNHNPSFRRFLYLGHSEPGIPDMTVATPIHLPDQNGRQVWALLTVQKAPRRGGQPKIFSHGFVAVEDSNRVMERVMRQGERRAYALETGQVLTLPEVFEELAMLYSPNWRGGIP